MASLTGQQKRLLRDCIVGAFQEAGFYDLLLFNLNIDLKKQIASAGDTFRVAVTKVIVEAEGNGYTADLLRAVAQERPNSKDVQNVVRQLLPVVEDSVLSREDLFSAPPKAPAISSAAPGRLPEFDQQLPPDGSPPTILVHRYSGTWNVRNRFSVWRSHELGENDRVAFAGTTYLLVTADGQKGCGSQMGILSVSISPSRASYQVATEIYAASVDSEGALHLCIRVKSRVRIDPETGELPHDAGLFGNQGYRVDLSPVVGRPRRMHGTHIYTFAGFRQEAVEDWDQVDFATLAGDLSACPPD